LTNTNIHAPAYYWSRERGSTNIKLNKYLLRNPEVEGRFSPNFTGADVVDLSITGYDYTEGALDRLLAAARPKSLWDKLLRQIKQLSKIPSYYPEQVKQRLQSLVQALNGALDHKHKDDTPQQIKDKITGIINQYLSEKIVTRPVLEEDPMRARR